MLRRKPQPFILSLSKDGGTAKAAHPHSDKGNANRLRWFAGVFQRATAGHTCVDHGAKITVVFRGFRRGDHECGKRGAKIREKP
jgi:hypothetical protein